jgi:hypothetical protein
MRDEYDDDADDLDDDDDEAGAEVNSCVVARWPRPCPRDLPRANLLPSPLVPDQGASCCRTDWQSVLPFKNTALALGQGRCPP